MLRVFVGVDRRQMIAYSVLQNSICRQASAPVAITPLYLHQLPINRRGLTDFTFSRYLVPYLCNFEGTALFIDADFLCLSDIQKLFNLQDPQYAVQVVKNAQRFEWPSLMLFNNEKCKDLTPEFVQIGDPQQMNWGPVGALPPEWNHLVGYDVKKGNEKLIHYTQGIPGFLEMKGTDFYDEWHYELGLTMDTCSWLELMGSSVHAQHVYNRLSNNMKAYEQKIK